jgi:outer membrane lipoprotein-sorting protein
MTTLQRALAFAFAALCVPSLARADSPPAPTAADILGRVDAALAPFKDAVFESKLTITRDGKISEYEFTTTQKGPDRRLIRFTAPATMKGMGILVEDRDHVQVYLPGYKKVRRMATHSHADRFMGSDFTFEDIARSTYSAHYDATIERSDDKTWSLELQARPGQHPEYPLVKMVVEKATSHPVRIEYLEGKGKSRKLQERPDFQRDAAGNESGRVVAKDPRHPGNSSEITFKLVKRDSGIEDGLFSVTSLNKD